MILINTKTGKGFTNVCKEEAGRRIGLSSKQIGRWCKAHKEGNKLIEYFNNWIVCFDETKIKQQKGNLDNFKGKNCFRHQK